MTVRVNVGVDGVQTKKALREAVKHGRRLTVYATSAYGTIFEGTYTDMPEGMILDVVGPDPYRDRRWYASIERTNRGFRVV